MMLLLVALQACSGGEIASEDTPVAVVDAELLAGTWQVAAAPTEVMGGFTADRGWRAFYERSYDLALEEAGSDALRARVHAERFAVYRKAALLQANAIRETYGPGQRREGDPLEVRYLLAVAAVVHGDLDHARELLEAPTDRWVPEVAAAAAVWKGRLADGSVVLGPDTLPLPERVAPWSLPETVGGLSVEVVDPTALLALGAHERSAAEAIGGVKALMAPWTLPFDAGLSGGEAELEARFLGPWPAPGDLAFVAAAGEGRAIVAEHEASSPLAAALSPCLEDGFDLPCISDAGADLAAQLEGAMAEAAGGEASDHRHLASLARVGLLRAAARLAEAEGERETSGRLMVEALDRSLGPAADPAFFTSLAAWDTANRNAVRAQELLHPLTERFEGLAWARTSLDALHLRVSRDAGPGLPMH